MAELKETILKIVKEHPMVNLATINEGGLPWTRYVMVKVADDMTLRVATFLHSRKIKQIEKNPEVHVCCGVENPAKMTPYLQIQGRATVSTDETERKELWCDELTSYFKGPDDPNYAVVIITPYRVEVYSPEHLASPQIWEA